MMMMMLVIEAEFAGKALSTDSQRQFKLTKNTNRGHCISKGAGDYWE
jgi:hypothetical protein